MKLWRICCHRQMKGYIVVSVCVGGGGEVERYRMGVLGAAGRRFGVSCLCWANFNRDQQCIMFMKRKVKR